MYELLFHYNYMMPMCLPIPVLNKILHTNSEQV